MSMFDIPQVDWEQRARAAENELKGARQYLTVLVQQAGGEARITDRELVEVGANPNLEIAAVVIPDFEGVVLRVRSDKPTPAEALRRLSSMEGFTHAGVVDQTNPWCRELMARVDYAREALDGSTS